MQPSAVLFVVTVVTVLSPLLPCCFATSPSLLTSSNCFVLGAEGTVYNSDYVAVCLPHPSSVHSFTHHLQHNSNNTYITIYWHIITSSARTRSTQQHAASRSNTQQHAASRSNTQHYAATALRSYAALRSTTQHYLALPSTT